MTFIYWGGVMTGKTHLMRYARVNSKSYGKLKDKPILSLKYFIKFFTCKIKLFFLKIVNRSQ